MNRPGGSLARKFYLLLAFVIAGSTITSVYSYRSLERIRGDMRYVDLAARQNTLSETIDLYAEMVAGGQEEDRKRLGELVSRFDAGQDTLRRGGRFEGADVPPPPQSLRAGLDVVDQRWSSVRPQLARLASAATPRAKAAALYRGLDSELARLHRETRAVVDQFHAADHDVRSSMRRGIIGTAFTRIIIVVLVLWALHRNVLDPVQALSDAIARFRGGDRMAQAACGVEDEVGSLARSFNEMVAELNRLTTAIEQTDYGIVMTDPEGSIEYVNGAFETLTGYSRAEALGRTPRILKSAKQTKEFYAAMWTAIKKGETWQGRLVNERKDGSHFTSDLTITPVRGPKGAIVNFIGIQRNVTAILALEDQVRQMQKMDAIGRLAGGIAHDFNNLLTVITGSCELIKDELNDPAAVAADAGEIRKASQTAAALVRRLLALGRRQPAQIQVFETAELLENLRGMLRGVLFETIALEIKVGALPGRLKGDRDQLEQVVLNLAANARDAMPAGGKFVIEASAPGTDEARHDVVNGPCVRIAFRDTGAGFSDEAKDHLFEPFFTTKEKGRGTGMGLASSYGIVRQHHGHISVDSESGTGTVVNLYLPLVSEEPTKPAAGLPAARGGKETILLVEDEAVIRAVAQRILASGGYTVLIAASLPEAVEELGRHQGKIELLLTDVILEGHTGIDVARRIGELSPGIKTLFMSGYASDVMRGHGLLETEQRLLQKPFSAEALLAAVRAALDA